MRTVNSVSYRVLCGAALTASTFALVACSPPSEQDSTAVATTVTSTVSPSATVTTEQSPAPVSATSAQEQQLQPMGTFTTAEATVAPQTGTDLIPTGIRVHEHPTFTRVVIDLSGSGKPGWFATLTDQPLQQASGHEIIYNGTTALDINVDGTPWPSTPERQKAFLDIGKTTGAGIVTEINYAGSFEAQSQFVIGLQQPAKYSITYLENPSRVVIDIAAR
ncbi:MAG: hypothetical protein SOW59_02340 [Corynebacterium sp.]|nr:hypothetical protein [Corynebacterium sp.]